MKNHFFLILMLVTSLVLAHQAANAQSGPVELMCRNKAKEIAASTYQNCVTEEKTARLNDLKSRYKERMAEVKSEFQQELDDLNGKISRRNRSTPAAKKPGKVTVKDVSTRTAEKPVKGVARSLPTKKVNNGPAPKVQIDMEEQQAVIPTESVNSENSSEDVPEPVIIDVE